MALLPFSRVLSCEKPREYGKLSRHDAALKHAGRWPGTGSLPGARSQGAQTPFAGPSSNCRCSLPRKTGQSICRGCPVISTQHSLPLPTSLVGSLWLSAACMVLCNETVFDSAQAVRYSGNKELDCEGGAECAVLARASVPDQAWPQLLVDACFFEFNLPWTRACT